MLKIIKFIVKIPGAVRAAYLEEKEEKANALRKKARWDAYFKGYGNFE